MSPYPPDLINQLRTFAVLAQFRLQYDRGHPRTSVPIVPMPISFNRIPGNFRVPLYWIDATPELPPNEGIVAGEIIGHRCWRVFEDRLWSTVVDYNWIPRRVEEGNIRQYGIHSFKNETLAMRYSDHIWRGVGVIGTIKMWGEVVEHEHGYRAQYARVNSLDEILTIQIHGFKSARTRTRFDERLSKLREIYGCTQRRRT